MRLATPGLIVSALTLLACDDSAAPGAPAVSAAPEEFGIFGDGYPQAGDLCFRAGETAVTADYLDHTADLIACPPDTYPDSAAFEAGGTRLTEIDGWQLFSIPR